MVAAFGPSSLVGVPRLATVAIAVAGFERVAYVLGAWRAGGTADQSCSGKSPLRVSRAGGAGQDATDKFDVHTHFQRVLVTKQHGRQESTTNMLIVRFPCFA